MNYAVPAAAAAVAVAAAVVVVAAVAVYRIQSCFYRVSSNAIVPGRRINNQRGQKQQQQPIIGFKFIGPERQHSSAYCNFTKQLTSHANNALKPIMMRPLAS